MDRAEVEQMIAEAINGLSIELVVSKDYYNEYLQVEVTLRDKDGKVLDSQMSSTSLPSSERTYDD